MVTRSSLTLTANSGLEVCCKAHPVQLDRQAPPERPDLKAPLDLRALLDQPDRRDKLDHKGQLDLKALLDQPETQAPLDLRVLPDQPARQDRLGLRV